MIFDFSLITDIAVFLINAIDIWLILIVYFADPKKRINKIFILMAIFMLIWVDFAYLARLPSQVDLAIFWVKIAWAVTIPLFATLYFFAIYYIKEEEKHKILNKIVLSIGVFSFFISLFTNLVIQDIKSEQVWTKLIYGEGIMIFYGLVFFLAFLTFFFLLKKYFYFSKTQKEKTQYFIIGFMIFLFMNVVFNIIYPFFLNIPKYYQLGDYSTVIPLCFISYAITKHKLMGVKIILTSIFVALIAILLLLDILFLTPELLPQLYKGLLLIIFIYFGYLLIKSVTEEIKRREEMEILSRKLKKANLKLEKLVEMREEFLHITSHQLRTPLTAIRGMISMWHDGDFKNLPQEEKNEIKNRIYTSAERLNNITNDMINAMELEGKHFDFKFKPVSLEKIISDATNTLKINYHAKGLFLNFKKPKKAFPKIQADPEYLSQVFLNIINNAEKYTENGGTTISISQKAKNFIVEITDTGIGISKEGQKLLFRKFSRGQRAKKVNATGSGLGLYIAEQIIKTHHGEIKVKSAGKNKGTTFTVVLPIKQPKE